MDPEVQAFKDKMAEKAAAKALAMAAIGESDWDTVAKQGVAGAEGKAFTEAQAIAEAYVKAHPDVFAIAKSYADPSQPKDENGLTGHVKLVNLIDLFRQAGDEEASLVLSMYELVKFERQTIGATPTVKVRVGAGE